MDAAATWSGCTAYDARSSKLLNTVVSAKSKLSSGFSFICASMDTRYGILGGRAISASRKRSSNARFSSGVGNSFTLNNTMCFTILIYICIFVLVSANSVPLVNRARMLPYDNFSQSTFSVVSYRLVPPVSEFLLFIALLCKDNVIEVKSKFLLFA